jgi:hypothetical protein
MSKDPSLTPRQQFWAEHLRQCARRGQSLAAYAAEHGLKVGGLYEAKSRLRRRGLCPVTVSRFVRVHPARASQAPQVATVYRVSLPNGVVIETTGGELSAVLCAAAQLP